jgi:hypothetical protein
MSHHLTSAEFAILRRTAWKESVDNTTPLPGPERRPDPIIETNNCIDAKNARKEDGFYQNNGRSTICLPGRPAYAARRDKAC